MSCWSLRLSWTLSKQTTLLCTPSNLLKGSSPAPNPFTAFVLRAPFWDFLMHLKSNHSLLGCNNFPPHFSTTPETLNPEEPRATCLAWEHLTQSLVLQTGATKLRLSQGKGPPQNPTGGQRQGWDPKPRLQHIPTHQDPCWEINPNQALELWGECRHSINIQMRETFRRLFSLGPHPFLHRGLASLPPGSGKNSLVNWAVSKPFCVKTLGALEDAASLWSHNAL